MQTLSLRLTHTYVGTYAHLDKWADIGTVRELGRHELPLADDEHDDVTDPRNHELFLHVQTGPQLWEMWLAHTTPLEFEAGFDAYVERNIVRALRDMHTSHGCAHEYDCCGCRSFSAEAERFSGDVWRVVVSSSRNY